MNGISSEQIVEQGSSTVTNLAISSRNDVMKGRWLRVSPYLLLSWLAAGFSLPIAINIVLNTQNSAVQSIFSANWQTAYPSELFQIFLAAKDNAVLTKFGVNSNLLGLFSRSYQSPYKIYQPVRELSKNQYSFVLITEFSVLFQQIISRQLLISQQNSQVASPHFLFLFFNYTIQNWLSYAGFASTSQHHINS